MTPNIIQAITKRSAIERELEGRTDDNHPHEGGSEPGAGQHRSEQITRPDSGGGDGNARADGTHNGADAAWRRFSNVFRIAFPFSNAGHNFCHDAQNRHADAELPPQSGITPELTAGTTEEVLMHRRIIATVALVALSVMPAAANTLVVAEVRRGCIVEFEGGFTVHLTGIVVPGPNTQVGLEAHDFAKRRLEGKRVAVFTWTTDNTAAGIVFGDDGLASAKIVYGGNTSGKGSGTDIAAQLLELGYARVDPERLPDGYEHYLDIERRAKEQKLGLWAPAD